MCYITNLCQYLKLVCLVCIIDGNRYRVIRLVHEIRTQQQSWPSTADALETAAATTGLSKIFYQLNFFNIFIVNNSLKKSFSELMNYRALT